MKKNYAREHEYYVRKKQGMKMLWQHTNVGNRSVCVGRLIGASNMFEEKAPAL